MQILIQASVILLAYIFGSIPFGLMIVKAATGKDIREVASGRTGGTNAARAAGAGAGLLTAVMDGAKGASAVWMAQAVAPGNHWLHVLAPIAAILGHNYSIFLTERDANNRLRLRGGAGGGPTVGGALGLWWQSALIVLPLGALVFFGIGYASITTMSVALIITAIFSIRYTMGLASLPDVYYGVMAFALLVWALRPNIKALIEGRERFHGWRPWQRSKMESAAAKEPPRKREPQRRSSHQSRGSRSARGRKSASSRG
jgi:glycerol-3-phosphate acyltransferase PlsY